MLSLRCLTVIYYIIRLKSDLFLDITLHNLTNIDFDLWAIKIKFKSDGVIGLPIYNFLLMFNSNI